MLAVREEPQLLYAEIGEHLRAEAELAQGMTCRGLHHGARHLLALFQGQPGTKVWKRVLSEEGMSPTAGPEVLLRALDAMPERGRV